MKKYQTKNIDMRRVLNKFDIKGLFLYHKLK